MNSLSLHKFMRLIGLRARLNNKNCSSVNFERKILFFFVTKKKTFSRNSLAKYVECVYV